MGATLVVALMPRLPIRLEYATPCGRPQGRPLPGAGVPPRRRCKSATFRDHALTNIGEQKMPRIAKKWRRGGSYSIIHKKTGLASNRCSVNRYTWLSINRSVTHHGLALDWRCFGGRGFVL